MKLFFKRTSGVAERALERAGVKIISREGNVLKCKKLGAEFFVYVFNKQRFMVGKDGRLDTGIDERVYEELIKHPDDYVLFAELSTGRVVGAKILDLPRMISAKRPDSRAFIEKTGVWIVRFWVDMMKPPEKLFELTAEALVEALRKAIRQNSEEDALLHPQKIGVYHPSEIGYCLRKQYYSYVLGGAGFSDETLTVFAVGDAVHRMVADFLEISAENREVEIRLPVGEGAELHGRADIIIAKNGEERIIEVKSTSHDYTAPKPEHELQLQVYLHALGIERGILLYIGKTSGKITAFDIRRDPQKLEEIKERVLALHRAIISRRPPPPEGKLKPLWQECRYCPFKHICDAETSGQRTLV